MSTGANFIPGIDGDASNDGTSLGEGSSTTGNRHEKSLGLLTAKFVALLQSADDGILDLKAVGSPYPSICC